MVISIEACVVSKHLAVMLHAFNWKFTQCRNVTLNLFFRGCTLGFQIVLFRGCSRWCLIKNDFMYSHFIHLQVFLRLRILSGASQPHSLWSFWLLRCITLKIKYWGTAPYLSLLLSPVKLLSTYLGNIIYAIIYESCTKIQKVSINIIYCHLHHTNINSC